MAEYIERDPAVEAAAHAWAKGLEPSQYIEIIPAADVAPVQHGRWEHHYHDSGRPIDDKWYCSECNMCNGNKRTWYCPNCGARMSEGPAL